VDAIDAARNGHGDGLHSDRHDDSDSAHRDVSPDGGNACTAGHDVAEDDRTDSRLEGGARCASRPAEFAPRPRAEAAAGTAASLRA
jgi:hypothetical protein